MAIARSVLQADAPLPTGGTRGGARVGRQLLGTRAGHNDRAVARQPMAPTLVTRVQCLLDQEPAKATAIDEEIAVHLLATLKANCLHMAVLRIEHRVLHTRCDPLHTKTFCMPAQEACIEPCVDMESMVDLRQRRRPEARVRPHEAMRTRRRGIDRTRPQIRRLAGLLHALPVVVKRQDRARVADRAKSVHIAVAKARPVTELDAQFEGRLRLADKGVLVQTDQLVEQLDHWDRRFTNANRRDVRRLDQLDRVAAVRDLGKRSGRHPAGRAATHNDEGFQVLLLHRCWPPAVLIGQRRANPRPAASAPGLQPSSPPRRCRNHEIGRSRAAPTGGPRESALRD